MRVSLAGILAWLRSWLRLLTLALVLLFLVLSSFGAKTFLLEFRTTVMAIEFGERGGSWTVPTATLCLRGVEVEAGETDDVGETEDEEAQGEGDAAPPTCNPDPGFALYGELVLRDPIFAFGRGMGVEASVDPDGRLSLAVRGRPVSSSEAEKARDAPTGRYDAAGGLSGPLPEGSRIYVDAADWRAAGAFAFEGLMRAGAIQSAGRRTLMLGGHWEARMSGLLAGSWVTGATEVVKTEALVRGSRVEVVRGDAPAYVYGHFTRGGAGPASHLEAVALSAPGATGLRISHFGTGAPNVVRPDIVDIALSSPLLPAIAAVLTLLTSALQVYMEYIDRLRRPRPGDLDS